MSKAGKRKNTSSLSFIKQVTEEDLQKEEANKQRGGFAIDPVKRAEKLRVLLTLLLMKDGEKLKFENVERPIVFSNIGDIHKRLGVNKDDRSNKVFRTSCIEKTKVAEYGKKKSKTPTVGTWIIERLATPNAEVKEKIQQLITKYENELENLTTE